MSDQLRTPLVEKRSVQIIVLVLGICATFWALFFACSTKEKIIFCVVCICLRGAFDKPIAALEEGENPRYDRFKLLFRMGSYVVILLPALLEIVLRSAGVDASLEYGSSLTLIVALYLVRAPLSLLIFCKPAPKET